MGIAFSASGKLAALGKRIDSLSEALIFLGAMLTFLPLLARWWWGFDVVCSFVAQYTCLLVVGISYCGWRRHWKTLVVAAFALLLNLYWLIPGFWPVAQSTGQTTAPLRLLLFNVFYGNSDRRQAIEFIKASQADLVLLLEVNWKWEQALAALAPIYPYRRGISRSDSFGIWLLSRQPFRKISISYLGSNNELYVPSIIATLRQQGREFTLIGTHPLPPRNSDYARLRNWQLQKLAATVKKYRSPVILAGDLNTAPWSPYFRDLVKNSGLRDSRRGFGIQCTWPAKLFWLWTPIDHCLVSAQVVVKNRRIGPNCGSDHYPVIIDLALRSRN